MKTPILLLFVVLLFSCKSRNKVIEAYIKEDSNKNLDYVLVKEKVDSKVIFEIFKRVYPKALNIEDNQNFELKYSQKNDLENWKKTDFKNIHFKLIDKDSIMLFIDERRKNLENKYYADKFNLYYLSSPNFYANNKYAFFNIIKAAGTDGIYPIYNNLIIMKREKGKWVLVEKREIGDLY